MRKPKPVYHWTPEAVALLDELLTAGHKQDTARRILNERTGGNYSKKTVTVKARALGHVGPKRIPWTPEAEDLIRDRWGVEQANTIRIRLKALGLDVSLDAVRGKAARMGLDYRHSHGMMSITDAAEALGCSYWTVARFVAKHPEGVIRPGHAVTLIKPATWEALQAKYPIPPTPPEPTISVAEAAEGLALSPNCIRDYCREGRLRGWRTGKTWQVSLADADRLRRELGIRRTFPQLFGQASRKEATAC